MRGVRCVRGALCAGCAVCGVRCVRRLIAHVAPYSAGLSEATSNPPPIRPPIQPPDPAADLAAELAAGSGRHFLRFCGTVFRCCWDDFRELV